LAVAAVTARVFAWPPQQVPAHVSAIVMLNGPGDRTAVATRLARTHVAPILVVSTPTPILAGSSGCLPSLPAIRVMCFNPVPKSTRGEAEYVGRLASRYHWRSVLLVTIAPQNVRSRLRLSRCFSGQIDAVDAPLRALQWPYELAYEWGAMIKALVFQRGC
jgi:hypothetical protein